VERDITAVSGQMVGAANSRSNIFPRSALRLRVPLEYHEMAFEANPVRQDTSRQTSLG
jgi:hypothetical protein